MSRLVMWRLRCIDTRTGDFFNRTLMLDEERMTPVQLAAFNAILDDSYQRFTSAILPFRSHFREVSTDEQMALGNSSDFGAMCVLAGYVEDENGRALDSQQLAQRLDETRSQRAPLLYEGPANCESVLAKIAEIESDLICYLAKHPHLMREMHSDAFEKLVAELLASLGYDVEWTGRNKATAGDVIAFRVEETSGLASNFLIECKRYAEHNRVGMEIARALYGAKTDERFSTALLVTTSTVQSGVEKFASRNWDFQYKDFAGLVEWLNQYRPREDGKLYMKDRKLILPDHLKPKGDNRAG